MTPAYTYAATVDHVVDGDTVALSVDLGFHVTISALCRLVGLNARELHDTPGGPAARDHLRAVLPAGTRLTVESVSADKYGGRFDAVLYLAGASLNAQLIADQWAAAWDGTGTRPVPPWPRTVTP